MSEVNWPSAVASALTEDERNSFLCSFLHRNPAWRGATVADILDALVERDSDLGAIEPFFERHPELIGIPGAAVTARALIYAGRALSQGNFGELHGRAAKKKGALR